MDCADDCHRDCKADQTTGFAANAPDRAVAGAPGRPLTVRGQPHKFTAAEEELIRRLRLEDGLGYVRIGRRLGVSEGTVRAFGERRGWPGTVSPHPGTRNSRHPIAPIAPIVALLDEGLTWTQIAAALGLTKNAVAGRIDRARCRGELPMPPPKKGAAAAKPVHDPFAEAAGGCLFPIGHPDSAAFRFCGADRRGCDPYCPTHHAVCFVAIVPAALRIRDRDAARLL